MPIFNNGQLNVELLSQEGQNYLKNQGLVDNNNYSIDWSTHPLEQRQQIIKQLVSIEKNHVDFQLKRQLQATYKANYKILFFITALALFGVGFSLAPMIAGTIPIVIPLVPVFLLSVAVIALTKIFLEC